MPTLSMYQIAGVAWQAGFRGTDLRTAAAVGMAESSGRTDAISPTNCCVGIWQINTDVHKQYNREAMKEPFSNGRAAWEISYHGSNWRAWDAYKSGAYLMFVPSATAAVSQLTTRGFDTKTLPSTWDPRDLTPGTDSLFPDWLESLLESGATNAWGAAQTGHDVVEGVASAADTAGESLAMAGKAAAWASDRNNWIRIMKVILGGGLVLVGLAVVTRPAQAQVLKVAGAAAGVAGKVKIKK